MDFFVFFILIPNSLFHAFSTFMISSLTGDGVDALQEYLLDQVCLSTYGLNLIQIYFAVVHTWRVQELKNSIAKLHVLKLCSL